MKKIDFRNLSKKDIKNLHKWLRAFIQIIFFIFLPSAFTAAFNGVKYIFTQIGNEDVIEFTSFISALIVLCAFTMIFGRFFCGFACVFGSLGDAVRALYIKICKKLKKKPVKISTVWVGKLMYLKYIILSGIVILCYCRVYGRLKGISPWDVFSMIQAGNFRLSAYGLGIVFLLTTIVGMALEERYFCKFFCPMGAVFSLLPTLPFFTLKRERENCLKNCKACTNICPVNIGLPDEKSLEVSGDCFQCQKCIDICPKGNVHCGIKKIKGNEFLFTIIRAVLLFIVLLLAGI
ncbi:MAG: 4Fe-4S binding protein [Ruminococcus sp.]|nr:4Fe-4S binding protein [Ruminococcus sp.]